jgi:predicted MFS family arabinose efflux permease
MWLPPAPSFVSRDAALICCAGTLRAAAVSLTGVLIAIHLAGAGLSPAGIGLIIGCGVTGNTLGTVLTGMYADRWGRRRTLVALCLLGGAGYAGLVLTDRLLPLAGIALAGMLNGMGRDRGPGSALDQALLPAVTPDQSRTWVLAWYNAAVDTGHAVGALAAVTPTLIVRTFAFTDGAAHQLTFALAGLMVLAGARPYGRLTPDVERPRARRQSAAPADVPTRAVVRRLACLFGVDSIGGGFLNSALVAYWFFERYGISEAQLAVLFFAARTLNVLSHLAAAWMARRIGLLNTMVMTHLPSSILLMLAPAAPTAALAAMLFLAREALVEMDVPTRQSYVMAVVRPEAQTFASSLTNVARNAGWAVGPLLGGTVMQHLALAGPLFIGATLKIAYDVALYRSFRHVRPPEEAAVVRG